MSTQRRWSGAPLGRLAVMGAGQIGGSVALARARRGRRHRGRRLEPHAREAGARAGAGDHRSRGARRRPRRRAARRWSCWRRRCAAWARWRAEIARALEPQARSSSTSAASRRRPSRAVEPKLRAGGVRRLPPDRRHRARRPRRRQPAAVRGQALRHLPDAAAAARRRSRRSSALWTAMGAEPVRMDAELHDRVLGAGSHLPHVAAYALAATLGASSRRDVIEGLRRLPTPSLRDTTRVAASSPVDVARHLPRQPRRGAAADRGAGGSRSRRCAPPSPRATGIGSSSCSRPGRSGATGSCRASPMTGPRASARRLAAAAPLAASRSLARAAPSMQHAAGRDAGGRAVRAAPPTTAICGTWRRPAPTCWPRSTWRRCAPRPGRSR